jgi:pyridoxine/pyridoxamine 5'-phosphate oxidase
LRHLVWTVTIGVLIALPFSGWLPQAELQSLPTHRAAPVVTVEADGEPTVRRS